MPSVPVHVFFLDDDDDALGPEALGRLHDLATRNGSDVVIGKTAGHWAIGPVRLFARTTASRCGTPRS